MRARACLVDQEFARFPRGERILPNALVEPLRRWHARLGQPEVTITPVLDEKDRPTGRFRVAVQPLSPMTCVLGTGVEDAVFDGRRPVGDLARGIMAWLGWLRP